MTEMDWTADPADHPGELTNQHHYVTVALLPPLIGGDPDVPLFSCPECGAAVLDTVTHDQHHAEPVESADDTDRVTTRTLAGDIIETRTIRCHCPHIDTPVNPDHIYWWCSVHNRGSKPAGPILRGDGGIVDRDTLRIWSEQ